MTKQKILSFTLARASIALASFSIVLPHGAQAQESFATEGEKSDVYELPPFTVSARRFDTETTQVAASVFAVDASTIRETDASSMADVLEELGVNLRSYTGNPAQSTIDLRGYGESGNLNTLVLIDGRRINAPDMSGINWLNMPLVSVETVEVLRGSQSAFYGNNAGGGVINVTTNIPEGTGASALLGYGSWDTLVVRGAAWTPLGANVRTSTELGYMESDGYRDNSGYRTRSISQSLQGRYKRLQWKAGAGYDKNWFLFPGPLDSTTYRDNPRACGYAPLGADYYSESENSYLSAALESTGDSLQLHADLNWNHVNNPWNMGAGLGARRVLDTWKFAPRARYSFSDTLEAILGADVEYDDLQLSLYNDLEHTDRRSHSTLKRSTAGLYGNLSWKSDSEGTLAFDLTARAQTHRLKDHFIDDTGLKNEEREKKSGSDEAFSLGASWRPSESLRLWTRADRFFRYPAIDEVVAYQGYDLSVPFNRDLDSEYGWSGELGADWSLPHSLLRINAFVQDVKDLIAFDYMQNLNVNLSDARRQGIEASAQFVYGAVKGGLFYTLLDVELRSGPYEGKELYLVPRHQIRAHLEWTCGRFSLRTSGRYTGSQWQGNDYENKRDKMPGYFVMDVLARYRWNDSLSLYAGVDNALDRHYSTLRYSGVWYPSATRSWKLGAQLSF